MESSRISARIFALGWLCISIPVAAQVRNDVLYESIVAKNSQSLEEWISAGGQPDSRLFVPGSDKSIGLLDLAVRARNEQAALILLRSGADAEYSGELVRTAVQVGMVDFLAALIERNPNQLSGLGDNRNPLLIAVGHGHRETLSVLLDRTRPYLGSEEWQSSLDDALLLAISSVGDTSMLRELLQAGADVTARPVVTSAVMRCSAELTATLLEQGADPNEFYGEKSVVERSLECFDSGRHEQAGEILAILVDAGGDACAIHPEGATLTAEARRALERVRDCD